jgi:hypothetical protein
MAYSFLTNIPDEVVPLLIRAQTNAGFEAYSFKRYIDGRGLCGLMPMTFTIGLFYGLDADGNYTGRYCFADLAPAKLAIETWDGIGDPPGPWIKHNGIPTYYNPEWVRENNYIQ